MPPHGKQMSGPRPKLKPKEMKHTVARLLSYMKEYKVKLLLVLLCVLVSALASSVGTYMLKPAINDYIVPFIGLQNVDLTSFITFLTFLGLMYAFGALATYITARTMMMVSTGTLNKIRKDLFAHLQTLPISYFDTHTHGELMSHFTNDVDTLREFLSQSLTQAVTSALTLLSMLVLMISLSPLLTLALLLLLPLSLLVIQAIGKYSSKFFVNQQKAVGALNGYIEEMIDGQRVVKVFCHEDKTQEGFDERNTEVCKAATNANSIAGALFPVMSNLGNVQYVLITILGVWLLSVGRLQDVGTLITFMQYTRNFSMPITQLSQQFNTVLQAIAGADRIFKVLDTQSEIDEGYVTLVNAHMDKNGTLKECEESTGIWAWKHPHKDNTVTYTQVKGDVQFDDVSFSYVEGKVILDDITLYARPGEKIAFVGSTGAGKTTITNLINRFYDIQEGKIRYDGINIRKIKKDDLRRSLGAVLQDTHLFTGTIRENIQYGNLHATEEQIIKAAKIANAHSFIMHLENGYDTMITNDGGNLSQGQRQLLSIARAAVNDPPVLILDEATSSIDTRTESLIQKGMDELMKGRTVFVIAHRLSTVRNAEAIMVLEHGKIIERGDHDDLIAQKGKYYQLYTGMFELS